jgi:hypothetical protein
MKTTIIDKLKTIEHDFDVNILFACESGSRAWGFASPDSDYDVRFIYVHKQHYYLSIEDQRDVIELPVNSILDINGWDLRKALRLFRKSNAPIYEWFQSPVIYKGNAEFLNDVLPLMNEYFSPRAAMHHYLSMTKSVFEGELSGEEVRLKKYFYALRPVLACEWIATRSEVPPMEFGRLRLLLPENLNLIVDNLLQKKMEVDEKFMIPQMKQLNQYVKDRIEFCENAVPATGGKIPGHGSLNQLFRKYLL